MKFEIEINDDGSALHGMTFYDIGKDLEGMWRNPHVLLAQPGNGTYVIHRVIPAATDGDFERLLDGGNDGR